MKHQNAGKHTGCIGDDCPICPKLDLPGYESARAHLAAAPTARCRHLGRQVGLAPCATCLGAVSAKVFECGVHGRCTAATSVPGVVRCLGCKDWSGAVKWAVGVTAVPMRCVSTLPKALASLRAAGWPECRLFVDGGGEGWAEFECPVTVRVPKVGAFASWALGLAELYCREPSADRYLMVQDDALLARGLRSYLEQSALAVPGYWNLYTFPPPEQRALPGPGWHPSNQLGKGAVALAFTRPAVVALLSAKSFVNKPQDAMPDGRGGRRATRNIDGAVVTALGSAGIVEYVHSPSLAGHQAGKSSLGNGPYVPVKFDAGVLDR